MAYGLRYQFSFDDEDEITSYDVELYQDGYTHGVEPDLVPADVPVILGYRPEEDGDNPNWLIALSRLTINVIDLAGRLSALGSIAEREIKVILKANNTTIFEGYAVPGEYSYARHEHSVATINCVRAESFMKMQLYLDADGEMFADDDIVSPVDVIKNCQNGLDFGTGETPIVLVTGCYWAPWLTNQLDGEMDVLDRLRIQHSEYKDNDGNPIARWSVLENLCRQYQLQLINDVSTWFAIQRVKVVDEGENTFEAFAYTGTGEGPAAFDLPYLVDIWDDDKTTLKGYSINHTRPYKYVSAIYNHLGPEEGIIGYGGFEAPGVADSEILNPVVVTADNVWIVSSDLAGIAILPPGATFEIATGPRAGARGRSGKSLAIPAVDGEGVAPDGEYFSALPYVLQTTSGFVQGGADVSLIIRMKVRFSWAPDAQTGVAGDKYIAFRFKVEDFWSVTQASEKLGWDDAPAGYENYNIFLVQNVNGWTELAIETDPLHDGENAITGPVYIELIAGVVDSSATIYTRYDDVAFEVVDADGNAQNQATQITSVYASSNNTFGPEPETLIFGDGPTLGHKRRQRILDGEGELVDIFPTTDGEVTGGWQFGRDFGEGEDPSGLSHLEFWTRELLQQHEVPLLTGRLDIKLHGELSDTFSPIMTYRDRRRLVLAANAGEGESSIQVTADLSTEAGRRGFSVIIPRRGIMVGDGEGVESQVPTFAVLTTPEGEAPAPGDVWTIHLEDTLANAHGEGEAVIQDILWTWTDYQFACRSGIVSLDVVELFRGASPTPSPVVSCSEDVKPGTLQAITLQRTAPGALSTPYAIGIPCFVETGPTQVWFLDDNNRVRWATIDPDSEPWTSTTAFTAASGRTGARKALVDLDAGYVFVKEDTNNTADYIRRYGLDGSGGTDIVTETWTTLNKIQDFGLDKENQLVYVLVGFGTPEAINVYDYDGEAVDTITLTDNSSVGNMAIEGDYIIYQATTNKLYRVVISTEVETQVDSLASPDVSQNSAVMDLAAGYYFYYQDVGIIIRVEAPDGGTETNIENVGVDQSGLGIDRFNQLLYFGSTDRIIEIDYDGAGNRTVIDEQADTFNIRSVDVV